jgi:PhzF family phenazine biosynthesis protein
MLLYRLIRARKEPVLATRVIYVDAFANKAFGGNQAAVVLLDRAAEAGWMQSVATEICFSETAFVVPRGEEFDLRWFSPACEVDLCGHATLATAHVLLQEGILKAGRTAVFHTASGILRAKPTHDGIEMDFPAEPAKAIEHPKGLCEALGAEPVLVGRNRMDILVELGSAAAVRGLVPDLVSLKGIDTRGVIVTAASDKSEYDFVSRFFAPRFGIDEDPVTGSAHCCLGPY